MPTNVRLTTTRLAIREYSLADFDGIHEYARDPETSRFMTWGPNSPQDTRNFINLAISLQKIEPRLDYHLVITLREGGRLIGSCGIHLDADFETGYAGYTLNKKFWGRGYATEALGALLKFGFEQLGIHTIKATCDTKNIASARVMEKNAMQRRSTIKNHLLQKGAWRDTFVYAILSSEWKELHP